jgi:hypothetical protein
MSQNEKITKGSSEKIPQEKIIMLKLAELLFRQNLISPDEQARLVQSIKKDGEV